MKLEKSDALLLHSVVFAYVNSNVSLDFIDVEHLEDLQLRLSEFVTNDERHSDECNHDTDGEEYDEVDEDDIDDDDDEDEDEDDEDEEPEESPIDLFVRPMNADALNQIKVKTPDGSTVFLEFEDVSEVKTVDALLDEGNVIIEGVLKVVVTDNDISLYDGEEWHDFKTVKLPKSWKKLFPLGKIVGFSEGEE